MRSVHSLESNFVNDYATAFLNWHKIQVIKSEFGYFSFTDQYYVILKLKRNKKTLEEILYYRYDEIKTIHAFAADLMQLVFDYKVYFDNYLCF